jgi:hypothetical protein
MARHQQHNGFAPFAMPVNRLHGADA